MTLSALEVFLNDMRYIIHVLPTYLLAYLLTYVKHESR